MVEYSHIPEQIPYITEAAFGLYVMAMCFTVKQRQAIRRRDNQECQMDCEAAQFCNPQAPLEVHHIQPQAYARQFGIDPDFPENGITLCRDFHQKEIHNMNIPEAQKALRERRVYWNTKYDCMFHAIAVRNTQRKKREGWKFPENE